MNTNIKPCFICGGTHFTKFTNQYNQCTNCGHETLDSYCEQGFILNDPLTLEDAKRTTGLDAFKSRVLMQFNSPSDMNILFDIGSASGKFLFLNQNKYRHAIGLEITPEALEFSRNTLHLNIEENIEDVPTGITTVTAWHSLEHIPDDALINIIKTVSKKMSADSRMIVSVPNGASRQYKWFRSAFAYFDTPNHLHQFTESSLTILMSKCGLEPVAFIDSWPYNTFGYIQGLLNITTRTHNYLYYRLKRRSLKPSMALDVLHLFILPLLAPVGWFLAILDLFDRKKQGVITACFKVKYT
ncbi:MAG: class I SAM-dependent methyltransferase [Aquabacterium sp.]|nr:class I SAM-dependent methyltransferase [Aquabacterium sp.]